ncbi:MAG: glycosyltransferase family 2 protein [Candidatus Cloacimonadales bacterium]
MEISRQQVAVIVPIYNAEKYLPELIGRIAQQIPRQNIIAVNDASQDSSASICQELQIETINFSHNRGKGAALQAGFKYALERGFSHAFSIDSDLQHLPEDIPRFLTQLAQTEADLIIGCRKFSLKTMPWPRIFSNSTTSKIVSLVSKSKIYDSQSGYRLYHLKPLQKMKFRSERYQFETEVILKLAKKNGSFSFVPIDTIYTDQVSYISHFRDIGNFIKIVCYEITHK